MNGLRNKNSLQGPLDRSPYVNIYIFTCIKKRTDTYVCIYIYVFLNTHAHMYTIHMRIYVYVNLMCIYIYTYRQMYANVCLCQRREK